MSETMSSVRGQFGSVMGILYKYICSNHGFYMHFAFEIRETGNEWDIDIWVT